MYMLLAQSGLWLSICLFGLETPAVVLVLGFEVKDGQSPSAGTHNEGLYFCRLWVPPVMCLFHQYNLWYEWVSVSMHHYSLL